MTKVKPVIQPQQQKEQLASLADVKVEGATSTGLGIQALHGKDVSKSRKDKHFCKCNMEFPSKQNLQKHVMYHVAKGKLQFKCPECSLRFKGTSFLRHHMQKIHKQSYDLKGCRLCGSLFENISELRTHQNTAHNQWVYLSKLQTFFKLYKMK